MCRVLSWAVVALVLLLASLLQLPPAEAHEARPAFLKIREVAPDQYELFWRTPILSGMPLPVALSLPPDARDLREPVTQRLNDSLLEQRSVETLGGLAGRRVQFLGLAGTITDVLVEIEWLNGDTTTAIVRPSVPHIDIAAPQSRWEVARVYSKLGIEHILAGIDHLLFVLALILITKGTWRLIKTVSAFTLAHSITLGLATLGYVHVPSRPVEAIIALSIVFVAAEVVHARRGSVGVTERAPWIVAFLFGLLHGLGFAGALSEIGLPEGRIPEALLFFNIGVEAGQLVFIAVVLALVAAIKRLRYNVPDWAKLVMPYVIGSVAMFWVFERVTGT